MDKKTNTHHKLELTACEIANLWSGYISDSAVICLLENFLANVEDKEIQSILHTAMKLSKEHIEKLTAFFNEENIPIPDGYSIEHDVSTDNPRLFTVDFYIVFIQNFCKLGMETYSYALSTSSRLDLSEYLTECLHETASLFNKVNELMLSKGIFIRSPYIPTPKMVEYVEKQSYLAGWFGAHRPMNVIEISGIYYNMIRNQLGRTLCTGFSQVAKSEKVRDYMIRGRDIANKHVEIFGSTLGDELLPVASSWDTLPTASTSPTFSDKLMMFTIISLNGIGVGNYGRNLGTTQRHDLAVTYTRLITEIGAFAEDGANIMIQNGWLEQVPQAPNRDQLANEKK